MGISFADLPESWNVNPADFQSYMTITTIVDINGITNISSNFVIGAFHGDECRGYAAPIIVDGEHIYFLMFYSNVHNESINLAAYDLQNDVISFSDELIEFSSNEAIGNPDNPYTLSFLFDDFLIGDNNNDGILNILDLVGIVEILLFGIEPYDIAHLDLNGDGGLNILDLVLLVDIILIG
tara:strand:- start:41 stop:583 length:543 start_codon:yes stop_codon:yes gene_type:complete